MALELNMAFKVEYRSNDDAINLLNLTTTIVESVQLSNVYVMVDKLQGDKTLIEFTINHYMDSSKQTLIRATNHVFVPDVSDRAKNFVEQAYEHLKSLNEYANAIDC